MVGKMAMETVLVEAISNICSLSEGNYRETAMKQVCNLNLYETLH